MKIVERHDCVNCNGSRSKYKLLSDDNVFSYACFICKSSNEPSEKEEKVLIDTVDVLDQTQATTEFQKNDNLGDGTNEIVPSPKKERYKAEIKTKKRK